MTATYEPIATTTLSIDAADFTFTSIPGTYTDLVLVMVAQGTVGAAVKMRFNSSSVNYSQTNLNGDGTSAISNRATNNNAIELSYNGSIGTTQWQFYKTEIFSYAGSTNKTILATASADRNGSGHVETNVGLWRDTAAITSIRMFLGGGSYKAGTTATLYGIKAE